MASAMFTKEVSVLSTATLCSCVTERMIVMDLMAWLDSSWMLSIRSAILVGGLFAFIRQFPDFLRNNGEPAARASPALARFNGGH